MFSLNFENIKSPLRKHYQYNVIFDDHERKSM